MNEIEAMKAEFAASTQATEKKQERSLVAEEEKAAKKRTAAREVEAAKPVMPQATATIEYRDPTTGHVNSATVTMRVILKTDERSLLHRLAMRLLGASWESSSLLAQNEAYSEAMCRLQWERDETVPEWFKEAYTSDPALADALAREVEVLTEAYFRGHDEAGRVSETRRFVVKRS
jgi:hypothetical protein